VIHTINTHRELVTKFGKYIRLPLQAEWKRWIKGDNRVAKVCDHKSKIKEWCCYCTSGCDMCDIGFECTECHCKFKDENNTLPTVTLIGEA